MSSHLIPNQEAFCLAYLETGNASEAYRRAYNAENMKPETVNRRAKELIDNGKIAARLTALQGEAAEKSKLTLESHLEKLRELRDAAADFGQFSAAIRAEIARGKAAGLYTEKVTLDGGVEVKPVETYDFTGVPQENLLELVREAYKEDKGGGEE